MIHLGEVKLKEQEVDNVAADAVGSVVQSFISNDHATEVQVQQQANSAKYTVTAQIPET